MYGVNIQNFSSGSDINIAGQTASHPIDSPQSSNTINTIANDILFSIFSHSDLPSFGVISRVCKRWKLVNNESLLIASVFRRYYDMFRYKADSTKFIELTLKNLNAFKFEKQEFLTMSACVCDWYSPIKINDIELTKKMAVKLADYLPQDKGHITTLPHSLYLLMSPRSRVKLTKDEKIELLLIYAENNPGMISYNMSALRKDVGMEEKDVVKLSKKCVAIDRRTLFYINFSSDLDISLLKQIQEENNIKDEDLNRIKSEAMELYWKDGEVMSERDRKPFLLGQ